jgi:hypothetical protein
MPGELVTRDTLRRELMLNAARKPLAIGVGLGVLIAGFAMGAPWLAPIALLFYLGIAASTFFDGNEAERVGQRAYARARSKSFAARTLPAGLSADLLQLLERARLEERRILHTIAESDLPFDDITVEVDGLAKEMEQIAVRAQTVTAFLGSHDPAELRLRLAGLQASSAGGGGEAAAQARSRAADAIQDQLRVGEALASELERFRAEMEHLIASLGVVHGQLVRITVSHDPKLEEDVAREVRGLRTRVGALADGLRDATDEVVDGT